MENTYVIPDEAEKFISKKIKTSFVQYSIKKSLKDEMSKSKYKTSELTEAAKKYLNESDLKMNIKNVICKIYQEQVDQQLQFLNLEPTPILPAFFTNKEYEPLEAVDEAQKNWAQFLANKFNNLGKHLNKPIIKYRNDEYSNQWPNFGKKILDDDEKKRKLKETMNIVNNIESSQVNLENRVKLEPVKKEIIQIWNYSDLQNIITSIQSSIYSEKKSVGWGEIKLLLYIPTVEELKKRYAEFNYFIRHLGGEEDKNFNDERIILGERLLSKGQVPALRQFARRGIPISLRSKLQKKILSININTKEIQEIEMLKEHVCKYELLTDETLLQDIDAAINKPEQFVFAELLEQLILMFSRDSYVADNCQLKPHISVIGLAGLDRVVGTVPPCGFLPFQLFPQMAAPFFYVSEKLEDVQFIFRSFQTKYLCSLHTISSKSNSLIGLCKIFEEQFQLNEAEAYHHMMQMNIPPLKIAFPWLFQAFSGYITIEQQYHLYDRILGQDSIEIISLLAVSIFIFRAPLIIKCTDDKMLMDLFCDLSNIQILPLLQHFLQTNL